MSGHDDSGDDGDGSVLSRRSLLAGTVGVGTVGALSGGSSVLLLTDQHVARNNGLTGPEMNLQIAWREYDSQANVIGRHGECGGGFGGYARHEKPAIEINDVEPGDRGALVVCARCRPPEGQIWARVSMWDAAERGQTSAEKNADSDDPGDGAELPHHLDVLLRRSDGCDYQFPDDGFVPSGKLADVTPRKVRFEETAGTDGSPPACLTIAWRLPESVPPTVRTDSVDFGVEFAAVQTRGTDGNHDPWGDQQ